jgi:hypothetical protein
LDGFLAELKVSDEDVLPLKGTAVRKIIFQQESAEVRL